MTDFQKRRQWSDKYVSQIKQILAQYLFFTNEEEDIHHNADLLVDASRIMLRVRQYKFYLNHPFDFTIRTNSKQISELSKILEGFGDYMFYGFTNEDESAIYKWWIGDMDVFRRWYNAGGAKFDLYHNQISGEDFAVFNIFDLPDDFIIGTNFVVYSGKVGDALDKNNYDLH
ncbi:MAG: hypothetical protein QXP36_04020 [Conexivisphaerales archaeon]